MNEAEESERASFPRSSSLKLVPHEIAPYLPGKRVTVDLKEALDGVSIDESSHYPALHSEPHETSVRNVPQCVGSTHLRLEEDV